MSNNNNSGSNRMEVPEAKEAMNRFKMEVANEIGVERDNACKIPTDADEL